MVPPVLQSASAGGVVMAALAAIAAVDIVVIAVRIRRER